MAKKRFVVKSAVDGKFVPKGFAKANPETTYRSHVAKTSAVRWIKKDLASRSSDDPVAIVEQHILEILTDTQPFRKGKNAEA